MDYDRIRDDTSKGAEKFLLAVFRKLRTMLTTADKGPIEALTLASRREIETSFKAYAARSQEVRN